MRFLKRYYIKKVYLRNQKGINDKNIGLTNEKGLNQLLAHHAVIFKPQDKLMWVSANPFQCGQFICYNLDSVFANAPSLNKNSAINIDSLTIPEDSFLSSKAYQQFLRFKQIKNYIIFITKKTHLVILQNSIENAFINSNPESYYMYQILGDYYASQHSNIKAIQYYEKALTKECATLKEEKNIKESMEKLIAKN